MGDKRAFPLVEKYNLIVVGIVCGVLFWMFEALVHMLFLGGSRYIRELFVLDSHEIWMRFTVFALLVGFGWFGQRIVDRQRRLRMKLAENEEKFRILSEQSLLGIVIVQDGLVKYFNEAVRQLTEYSTEDVMSWEPGGLARIWHPEDRPFIVEQMKKKQSGETDGIVTHYSYRMITKQGNIKWVDQYSKTITYQGRPADLATLIDITDRKRAEDALAEQRDHLEELVERRTRQLKEAQEALIRKERLAALGKVTAMVSHELRNPLGTVRTSVFSIGEAIKKDDMERVSRALVLAERNIIRCDNIIDELLDFSHTRELKSEETDIEDWLARLLDEGIVPGEITCAREFDSGCKVPIDRERMRRVVINVLTNAVHAMQEDGASGNRLTVSTRVLDSRLEICFNDTGRGFSDKDLDRLFEPMFSTKDFGVGLGLPIVRGIMQQHGGDIEIRNNSGKGATVTLWLPLSKPEEA